MQRQTEPKSRTRVQEFYADQNVLITGGTGFLGKLLIEKLIRTCTEINRVYVLIRPRKDECPYQRAEKLLEEPVFDRLKREVPDYRERIRVIPGDYSAPGLGLSASDLNELLRETAIVFNAAASVRFDEELKRAIIINIAGTREMMKLCQRMARLKVVIHVSTMFSNCIHDSIDEVFYKPPISADEAIRFGQLLKGESSSVETETILGQFPNVYVYTKCIAEDLVRQYGNELRIGIFRPAIIVSTYEEPVEGWVDNTYGPTGLITAAGIGILKTTHINRNYSAEIVPADYTVNALIAVAWAVANEEGSGREPVIYNYHSSWNNGITWGGYMDLATKYGRMVPSVRSFWCYSVIATKNLYLYTLLNYLLHYFPALMLDAALFLSGRKPRITKLYGKLQRILRFTQYFRIRNWKFSSGNTRRLWEKLTVEDRAVFPFSMDNFDWEDYMKRYVYGVRLYIFKDDPSTIPHARKRMARFEAIQATINFIGLTVATCFLYYAVYALFYKEVRYN